MGKKKTSKETPAEECIDKIRDALAELTSDQSLSIAQYVEALEEVRDEIGSEIQTMIEASSSDLK